MKKLFILFSFTAILFFTGCDDKDRLFSPDYTAPAAPRNVQVLSGDGYAEISWNPNRENDLDGYNVYVSDRYNGKYTLIGSTYQNFFSDNAIRNGRKYYYAVTAVDYNNNESELSYESAYAAPRPEGYGVVLTNYHDVPTAAGYDLSAYRVLAYDDQNTDVYFEIYQNQYYLVVKSDTDIQDMGPTRDILDITYAPSSGWSSTKDAIVKPGHTYVIWTWDDHYAKIRVRSISGNRITFDWAYQLIESEPTLKPRNGKDGRTGTITLRGSL